jgi:hypothetical protein
MWIKEAKCTSAVIQDPESEAEEADYENAADYQKMSRSHSQSSPQHKDPNSWSTSRPVEG